MARSFVWGFGVLLWLVPVGCSDDGDSSDATPHLDAGSDTPTSDASGHDGSESDASASEGGSDAAGNDAAGNDAGGNDAGGNDAAGNDAAGNDAGSDGAVSLDGGGGSPKPSVGCGKPATPGTFTRKKLIGTVEREYVLKIPANYAANVAHPLFFSFHGSGSNGAGAIGGNDTIAGVASIKVAPTNGDVPLVKALVADLSAELCVDETRIFATGYSAGGFLSNNVACQLGDVFRGAAVWEGGGSGSCPKPVAMWFNHNQDDTTVPISMGIAARDGWLKTNGCPGQNAPWHAPDPCVLYTGCAKAPVAWCSPATGGHKPPYDSYDAMIAFFTGL